MLMTELEPLLPRRACNDLARRLQAMYKTRLGADYQGSYDISAETISKTRTDAGFLLKTAREMMIEGRTVATRRYHRRR